MKELSLHIMDLAQNSITAKATDIQIVVAEDMERNRLSIEISDNGKGMTQDVLNKASDPFFTSRTTRDVGLGIPLFKQLAEQCNGRLILSSQPGKGTRLFTEMELNHIDRQPLGDIAGVMVLLLTANPGIRFIYKHTTKNGEYVFDTTEIKNVLGTSSVSDPGILQFIREMIQENLKEINIYS
ncbi:MAG: ATP-binding protein [Bacteroidales bacterium]|nr:ATP-binding protein [Bacteroidales bacterium]